MTILSIFNSFPLLSWNLSTLGLAWALHQNWSSQGHKRQPHCWIQSPMLSNHLSWVASSIRHSWSCLLSWNPSPHLHSTVPSWLPSYLPSFPSRLLTSFLFIVPITDTWSVLWLSLDHFSYHSMNTALVVSSCLKVLNIIC